MAKQPMSSLEFLKFITKCYTSQAFYMGINDNLANRNVKRVKKYIRSLIEFLEMNPEHQYRNYEKSLYRGVTGKHVTLEDYKVGSIGYFSALTSTSTDEAVGRRFAMRDKDFAYGVLFEIFVSPYSKQPQALQLPEDWSFYKEKEVLLMPFFNFQVVAVEDRLVPGSP